MNLAATAILSHRKDGWRPNAAASHPRSLQFTCATKTTLRNDVTASQNPKHAEKSQLQLLATNFANFANQVNAFRSICPIRGEQLFPIH